MPAAVLTQTASGDWVGVTWEFMFGLAHEGNQVLFPFENTKVAESWARTYEGATRVVEVA